MIFSWHVPPPGPRVGRFYISQVIQQIELLDSGFWVLYDYVTGDDQEFPTFPDLVDALKARRDALSPVPY